jgi:hypothetical protein
LDRTLRGGANGQGEIGATMQPPPNGGAAGVQQLLSDIRAGRIDVVVVYKVDRALDPHLAAKLPVDTVMGASIAIPRSDYGIAKSPRGRCAVMQRFSG